MARHDAWLWQGAMDEEMAAHQERQTWELVHASVDANVAGSRWAYDYKTNSDGEVNRYRAIFCLQGFTQHMGVDYDEVYAPCPAKATVRAVLTVVANQDLEAHALDVKNAHLNARMDKALYMKQLKGYEQGGDEVVCKSNLAIYGGKQAGNLWSSELHTTMTEVGAARSNADPNLYLWHHPTNGLIIILVHVDDTLTAAKTTEGVKAGKAVISGKYKVRDLGELKEFLGMRIERNRAQRTLFLSSPGHTQALLLKFNMKHANHAKVPMFNGTALMRGASDALVDPEPYAELVGSLLYLANTTRPDLAYAAGVMAR